MTRDQPAVLLATRSAHKAREIRDILRSSVRVRLITLDDAGIAPDPAEDDIEAFDTFLENAHAKAAWFVRASGMPTIADDSGICVHALGGAPGVRSRRFALAPGLEGLALDHANNDRLLHELRNTPDAERTAHYTCAAVIHSPDGHRRAAVGTCSGRILREPRGTGGFGYDPLFLLPGIDASFAEVPPETKHRFSHRARAFRALAVAIPPAIDDAVRH